ncbi:hypothetical protein AAC387_Pa03g0139 [Persea americana]
MEGCKCNSIISNNPQTPTNENVSYTASLLEGDELFFNKLISRVQRLFQRSLFLHIVLSGCSKSTLRLGTASWRTQESAQRRYHPTSQPNSGTAGLEPGSSAVHPPAHGLEPVDGLDMEQEDEEESAHSTKSKEYGVSRCGEVRELWVWEL